MKRIPILLLLSLPASAGVNTPFDIFPILTDLQIHHRPNDKTLIRFTLPDGTRYCQKVNVNDLNNAMKNWYADTGNQFIRMGTWYYNISLFLPTFSINQQEKDLCFANWK